MSNMPDLKKYSSVFDAAMKLSKGTYTGTIVAAGEDKAKKTSS